ncbi:hypothetical protein [Chryseobacterium sp.]|uniref:hypothetical protein n=1 Tax=Chryseobacterium sp. TaxID=1871047 RepID=UPI0035AEA93C
MKIATRTALIYSILTAGILFLFAYVLYFVSEKNREDEFNDRLGYKVICVQNLYLMPESVMKKSVNFTSVTKNC